MQSVQVDPLAELLGFGASPEMVPSNPQPPVSPYSDMLGMGGSAIPRTYS